MASQIFISYFAAARELTGLSEEVLSFDGAGLLGSDLLCLLGARHPQLVPHTRNLRLAVNDELVGNDSVVRAGDRVAILPPVAGGSGTLCELRETALSLDEAVAAVSHAGAGGIAIFLGVVRDHADGKPVARLDYEAHAALAHKEMSRIVAQLVSEHAGVRLCVLHRVGQLAIGDTAVIVAASAPHRAEAFAACRQAIDRIKETVPIWKKEWAADGTAHWVNLDGA